MEEGTPELKVAAAQVLGELKPRIRPWCNPWGSSSATGTMFSTAISYKL